MRSKAIFIPHGGGPLPLMNRQTELSRFLTDLLAEPMEKPRAIVIFSAHWEADGPTIIDRSESPGLLFDYYGFPPETYQYQWPGRGDSLLGDKILSLLNRAGFRPERELNQRGFDHGVFVPMMLMDPAAQIPIVQISLLPGLNPRRHIALGQALAPLLDENVMILGSGLSFHNMQKFFSSGDADVRAARQFSDWLKNVCTDVKLSVDERLQLLEHWEDGPHGRFSHPREEHLVPLFVVAGAALGKPGKIIFEGEQSKMSVLAVSFSV